MGSDQDDRDDQGAASQPGEREPGSVEGFDPTMYVTGGLRGAPVPVFHPGDSTPLEEDETGHVVPPCPLWAMKDRRHIQWHLLPEHERHRQIRTVVGTGDAAVYVIDDGRSHVMVGRRVAQSDDGCEYCLVGRAPIERFEALEARTIPVTDAFEGADELTLCGVVEETGTYPANVFDVQRYADASEIPAEFRPGAPYLTLDHDLEITVD